jgi:pilus assembly protein FimV
MSALIILALCAVMAGLMRWLIARSRSTPRAAIPPRVAPSVGAANNQPQWPETAVETRPFDTQILSQFPYMAQERKSMNPLTDAEVYLAFGNDRDAEALLLEAIRTAPMKVGLRIKLAEIYAQRRDSHSFQTVAGKLRPMVDKTGPVWEYICDLGYRLDPDNPDYRSAKAVSPETTAYLCAAFNTGGDGFEDTCVASLPMMYAGEGCGSELHEDEQRERMHQEHADRKSPVSMH